MQFRLLALLAALAPFALADVQFTVPKAGGSMPGGAITVEWKESGNSPSLTDLKSYQLFLCAGGNDDATILQLTAITTSGTFTAGNKAIGTIGIGVGASTIKNAYFFKMISVATEGGQVINYSDRFSLTGMTGTFPDAYAAAAKAVTGTDGPPTVNQVADGANPAQPVDPSAYNVPYTLQTGLTKFAPMQPVPPTKITKKNASPQYPTSAVTFAKTFLPTPKQVTTQTMSQTFSVKSMENSAPAAPMPSDDMAKFLRRWKD
ncbi:hypothetical protein BU16DRAFT_531577 [Lophium mytilinum]|uniref:Uncharacterized protein n=1 Tax=Lophium mytilinum TaxID=390894 RepID=A0A6A6QB81_9PEZI|nr:hypothetical protein BU16DRAFT_531577 [Lophium mytilinum]